MKSPDLKHVRILALAPSTRGFGFAVLEGAGTLVDWGLKAIKTDKNTQSVAKAAQLINQFEPSIIVLEDCFAKDSRRAPRIRSLNKRLTRLAAAQKLKLLLLPRGTVNRTFVTEGRGTKYEIAKILAERFPEELGSRLPPKRRPWMSEDSRMDIFHAVALASAAQYRGKTIE